MVVTALSADLKGANVKIYDVRLVVVDDCIPMSFTLEELQGEFERCLRELTGVTCRVTKFKEQEQHASSRVG